VNKEGSKNATQDSAIKDLSSGARLIRSDLHLERRPRSLDDRWGFSRPDRTLPLRLTPAVSNPPWVSYRHRDLPLHLSRGSWEEIQSLLRDELIQCDKAIIRIQISLSFRSTRSTSELTSHYGSGSARLKLKRRTGRYLSVDQSAVSSGRIARGGQAVDLSVLPLNEDRLLFKRDSMTGRKSKARRRDDTVRRPSLRAEFHRISSAHRSPAKHSSDVKSQSRQVFRGTYHCLIRQHSSSLHV